MKCSKISWAASFDLRLKVYQAANVDHDILFPVAILRKMQAHFVGLQAAFGASFASIATSSPMEVRTMTSENISEHHTFERKVDLLVSFSSVRKSFSIFSPTSPSGTLTSSLVLPSSAMRDRKPSSVTSS